MMLKFFFVSLLSFFVPANADQNIGHNSAVKSTQNTLKNPAKVKEITDADPKAKEVDQVVKELAGTEDNAKEMYSISADILPVLMEMNQDDPEKALQSLQSYSQNPAEFLKNLPPNIRERIQKLSQKIEKQHVKKKP